MGDGDIPCGPGRCNGRWTVAGPGLLGGPGSPGLLGGRQQRGRTVVHGVQEWWEPAAALQDLQWQVQRRPECESHEGRSSCVYSERKDGARVGLLSRYEYSVDFERMTQMNMKDKTIRPVKCIED